jgi:hypothetical protein
MTAAVTHSNFEKMVAALMSLHLELLRLQTTVAQNFEETVAARISVYLELVRLQTAVA